MKRFCNMGVDERRHELHRRIGKLLPIVRDMSRDDIKNLFAAAVLIDGSSAFAKRLLEVPT